jgi:hypothetical protein
MDVIFITNFAIEPGSSRMRDPGGHLTMDWAQAPPSQSSASNTFF